MTVQKSQPIDDLVTRYGDLLFDLCQAVVRNSGNAQGIFRLILKDLKRESRKGALKYETHERAWVLRVACDRVVAFAKRAGKRLSTSERIELDANTGVASRLKNFDRFFRRLTLEDQVLLILRDKYGLPYPEISTAMTAPEDSLKMRRQQALRALEGWLWENP